MSDKENLVSKLEETSAKATASEEKTLIKAPSEKEAPTKQTLELENTEKAREQNAKKELKTKGKVKKDPVPPKLESLEPPSSEQSNEGEKKNETLAEESGSETPLPVGEINREDGEDGDSTEEKKVEESSKPEESGSEGLRKDPKSEKGNHGEKEHEVEMKDYQAMEMPILLKELSRLLRTEKIQHIKPHVEEIKNEFNAKFEEEIEQKKEDFLEDGGNIIDFYYSSPLKKEFNSVYFSYKEKRNSHYKEVKKNLNQNLENRLAIIEELKGMIGLGDSMNANFNQFRDLQERWRKAGPIPRDQYNTVFNTYHHHVEHFYDFLHLDREFRDLDFKHNLEQKLKIIARAEELAEEPNSNRTFRELQLLHKTWKEDLGPVAKEYRDEVWDKFSEATKKIHEKRQEHFAEMDKKREEHLEAKHEIIERIKGLAEGEFNSHNKTQQKIKEIETLRKGFFNAGKVPDKKNKKVWSAFKEATRTFNRNKNAFYKNLKKEQYENLDKKKELIKIAEENKGSTDYASTTPLMKKIQDDWKKIGYVPRKDGDKAWKKFRAACNHYFDQMHSAKDEEHKEENEAFERKKAILDELKDLKPQGKKKEDMALIKSKIEEWKEIGRVPSHKNYIEKKFNQSLNGYFDKMGLEGQEAELLKYENRIQALDDSNDARKIEKEQSFLRKKIDDATADLRQLETNLNFFAHADQENPLVKEVHNNIAKHKEKLETWKVKLRKVKAL